MEWTRGEYTIQTELSLEHLVQVHQQLETYWGLGTPKEVTQKAFKHSLAFGVFHADVLVGWARVISDYAVFAYVADVFVVEPYRGRGLSKWLMECIMAHPELQGLRRWMLSTDDAHGLYAQQGFKPLAAPNRFMEVFNPKAYG